MRPKLVLLLLAFGLGPVALLSGFMTFKQGEFRALSMDRLADAAMGINDVIDRNLFERYGDVQAFGLNTVAHDPANWRRPGADNKLVHAMNDYVAAYGVYKLSILVGPEGDVPAVNSANAASKPIETSWIYGQNLADASWFKKALKGDFLIGRNGFTGTVVRAARRFQPGRPRLSRGRRIQHRVRGARARSGGQGGRRLGELREL